MATKAKITLTKSIIGQAKVNRERVLALFGKVKPSPGKFVIRPWNDSMKGLIHHVKHMVSVELIEVEDAPAPVVVAEEAKPAKKPRAKKTTAEAAE